MEYLVKITEDNFSAKEHRYESYEHFKQTVLNLNLNPECFFKDNYAKDPVNSYIYIESYVATTLFNLSEEMLTLDNLDKRIIKWREYVEKLQEKEDYEKIFRLIDGPLKIYCLRSLMDTTPTKHFIRVFNVAWKTIEDLGPSKENQDMLDTLKGSIKTTLSELLEEKSPNTQ